MIQGAYASFGGGNGTNGLNQSFQDDNPRQKYKEKAMHTLQEWLLRYKNSSWPSRSHKCRKFL